MKFKDLKKKIFKYSYGGNDSYDYDLNGYDDYNNYSNNYYNPYNDSGKNKKRKNSLIWIILAAVSSTVGLALIGYAIYTILDSTSSSIVDQRPPSSAGTNNTDKSEYTVNSDASYWISQRTLSLRFDFSDGSKQYTQSGTGWIYQADQDTNTFYIATNLHVANILSFNGRTITSFEGKNYATNRYSVLSAYVGLSLDLNENTNDYSNNITYFNTAIPEVIYTTTSDQNFNSQFSQGNIELYGLGINNKAEVFKGASDIAILKYQIDLNYSSPSYFSQQNPSVVSNKGSINPQSWSAYIDKFRDWINNYFANPTVVYKGYAEDIYSSLPAKISTSDLYMGGYPNKSFEENNTDNGLNNISWISFSNFKIENQILGDFYPSADFYTSKMDVETNIPIAFFDKSYSNANDYTSYNYLSVGLLSLIDADSFAGASGSPIVVRDSSVNFEIVGIYWGSISFSDEKNQPVAYGAMNWFATRNYELTDNYMTYNCTYNLTTEIDKLIQASSSTKI